MKHYVFALIKSENKILMLKRPKDKKVYPGYWNFPGGKTEEGETENQCIIREVKEETGLKFMPAKKIMDIIDEHDEPKRVTVYSGTAEGLINVSDEHEECGWFTIEETNAVLAMPYIRLLLQGEQEWPIVKI